MENSKEEIEAEIDRLQHNLNLKRYQYKIAFERTGGWDEAKKLHIEIKAIEEQLLIEKKKLK